MKRICTIIDGLVILKTRSNFPNNVYMHQKTLKMTPVLKT